MKRATNRAGSGEIAVLADEIGRSHHGDPWHGPGVADVLRGVTAAAAAARPIAGAHSIWELVLHLAAWRGARARLVAAEKKLQRALATFPPSRLGRVVGGERDAPLGTGVTYRVMLHGVAQHDAYHAGQVSLLRRALAGTRARRGTS